VGLVACGLNDPSCVASTVALKSAHDSALCQWSAGSQVAQEFGPQLEDIGAS
jgi:hypothetical protein